MGYFVKNQGSGRRPRGTLVPYGTTATQPIYPVIGTLRFNTDLGLMEYFDGIDFKQIVTTGTIPLVIDTFVGDDFTMSFTMSQTPLSAEQILVFVGGVFQTAGTSYALGIDPIFIEFTSAPPLDSSISVIHNIGNIT